MERVCLPPPFVGEGRGGGRADALKTPAERAALEAQGAVILEVFEAAGFAHIAPDILQPADVFLDRAGEEIRARTYVFTDPAGTELCLRPDLTVPACRYHLSHASAPEAEQRYCYQGPAFRFQPEGGCRCFQPSSTRPASNGSAPRTPNAPMPRCWGWRSRPCRRPGLRATGSASAISVS
jgi:hypothetical protein